MRRFALILALVPGSLAAEEFRMLSGDEILAALTDRKLTYEGGATQIFESSMQTQYFSNGPSTGRWAVRGDQYCSVWPPSDIWACYNIEQKGDVIRFIGAGGDLTDGTYVE
ncbi:hypothetical protein Q5Y75_01475 [Ruegeria sp. 2205SS24-7]|uniref:hypothetical protein n=1 Tax=Ruegeria discodermiae TaxID=3064389 RepID=UPI002740B28E|nr:hypothetical protein [Ruegeria sp. 2205SS24-7]MDP5215879.1 hypothetical protein [Ruegeria sp. 2205SS24-7]